MSTVAIDTTILVWGVRKERPNDGRDDLIERCVRLIEWSHAKGDSVIIPSVAAAEYLIGCSDETRDAQRKELFENFFVAPFDGKAAEIAARLYDRNLFANVRQATDKPRQCLKADYYVIATAIAHGAGCLYTDDKHMEDFAAGKLPVIGVPQLSEMAPNPEVPKVTQRTIFDGPGPVAE